MFRVDPLSPRQYSFLHKLFLFHCRELTMCRFLLLLLLSILFLVLLSFIILTVFKITHRHSGYLSDLKSKVELHHILNCIMRLSNIHVIEEHVQKLSPLLTTKTTREGELKNWLQNKRGHQLIKELFRFIHLIAFPYYTLQDIEKLFCDEIVIIVMFQGVNTMLHYFISQTLIVLSC